MKKIIILNFFNGITTKKVFYCTEDANEYFNKIRKSNEFHVLTMMNEFGKIIDKAFY